MAGWLKRLSIGVGLATAIVGGVFAQGVPNNGITFTLQNFWAFVKNAPSLIPIPADAYVPVVWNNATYKLIGGFLMLDASNAQSPTARVNGLGVKLFSPVKDHGADPTGVVLAATAVSQSIADCGVAGGGEIDARGVVLNLGSSGITFTEQCPLVGSRIPQAQRPVNYKAIKSAILVDGSNPPIAATASSIRGVAIISTGLPATVPTTYQQGAAMIAGMAANGTGMRLASGALGLGQALRDVQLLGFNQCIDNLTSPSATAQIYMENVRGDCLNGFYIKSSHDHSGMNNVEMWQALTASQNWTTATHPVTGVADNGAGKIRFTVNSTADFATGNTLFGVGVGGFTGANSRCTAIVIDATHVDCSNLQSTPTATAKLTAGSNVLVLTVVNNAISKGQTIADTTTPGNIVSGQTVLFTSKGRSDGTMVVFMSLPADGGGAADNLTFTNAAYTSAGSLILDNNARDGTAFKLEDNVLFFVTASSEFGWRYPLDVIDGIGNHIELNMDDLSNLGDQTAFGARFRGNTYDTSLVAPYLDSRNGLVFESTSSLGSVKVEAAMPAETTTAAIAVYDGYVQVNNSSIRAAAVAPILTMNTADNVQFCTDQFPNANFFWEGDAAYFATNVCPGTSYGVGLIARRDTIYFNSGATLAAGATYYVGNGPFSSAGANGDVFTRMPANQNGHLYGLVAFSNDDFGAAQTYAVTVREGSTNTAVTCTLTGNGSAGAKSCSDSTHLGAVGANSLFNASILPSAGATPARVIQGHYTIAYP